MSKPIVATNAIGCRDAVDEGVSGLLCRVADASDLAEKLLKMLEMPCEDRIKMGVAGRHKMEREFDEKLVIDAYLKVVEGVLPPVSD